MFLIAFIVSVAMALINLPWVMEGGVINIASMIFCFCLAVFNLVMATTTRH